MHAFPRCVCIESMLGKSEVERKEVSEGRSVLHHTRVNRISWFQNKTFMGNLYDAQPDLKGARWPMGEG